MEQDEPDVVELQDSDEGDVVFIGEGGPQKWMRGLGGIQVTQKGGTGNFGEDPDAPRRG